jgi:hypothetical protein
MKIAITFTRTLVQEVTVDVPEIIKAIEHIRQLPSYGQRKLDSLQSWLNAWDGEEEMPESVWDIISNFGLQTLANGANIETVDETIELDEVALADE